MSVPRAVAALSQYSYFGRHIGSLATLVKQVVPQGREIRTQALLLGSGPVEPLLVAALWSTHWPSHRVEITGVDSSHVLVTCLNDLIAGRPVYAQVLADLCRDGCHQPGQPNRGFTDGWAECVQEVERTVAAPLTLNSGYLKRTAPSDFSVIKGVCADVCEYLSYTPTYPPRLIYCGLLLANMRKIDPASTSAVTQALARYSDSDGVIGIGSSLSPEHGLHADLADLLDARLFVEYVSLEHAVLSDGKLYADYGLGVVVHQKNTPHLRYTRTLNPVLSSLRSRCQRSGLRTRELISIAESPRLMVLAALRAEDNTWTVTLAESDDVATHLDFERRSVFDTVQPSNVEREQRESA